MIITHGKLKPTSASVIDKQKRCLFDHNIFIKGQIAWNFEYS